MCSIPPNSDHQRSNKWGPPIHDDTKSTISIADELNKLVKSILECSTSDISNRIGVDQYIGQIIIEEAKRVTKEMAKEPPVPDEKTFTPPGVTIKREEI